jgi:two-component system, LytTR family, response regulator
VLIADDELMARKRLRRLLEAIGGVSVVAECVDGSEVLEATRSGGVDLLLLDIHMPNLTGLDAWALLGSDGPEVVFVTAFSEHAVAAFDGGAVDYVLKPVEPDRLRKALERARERIRGNRRTDLVADFGRLPLATARGIVLLDITAIEHASIEGASVVVQTADQRHYTDARLSELERRLPAGHFERVHRSALVNLSAVVRLEPMETGGYVACLRCGAKITVSRQAARSLRKRWKLS